MPIITQIKKLCVREGVYKPCQFLSRIFISLPLENLLVARF
jgi:hypothetical protein